MVHPEIIGEIMKEIQSMEGEFKKFKHTGKPKGLGVYFCLSSVLYGYISGQEVRSFFGKQINGIQLKVIEYVKDTIIPCVQGCATSDEDRRFILTAVAEACFHKALQPVVNAS